MTEQEAIDLIATKLLRKRKAYLHDGEEYFACKEIPTSNGIKMVNEWAINVKFFTPFHDSNHARMVKEAVGKNKILLRKYLDQLVERLGCSGLQYGDVWDDDVWFDFHNAPDDVCMWAVVDALNEVEK